MRLLQGLLAIVSVAVAVWIVFYGIMYGGDASDPIWAYFVFPLIFLLNAFCLVSDKANGGPRIFRLLNLWLEVKENDLRSRLRGTNTLSHPK